MNDDVVLLVIAAGLIGVGLTLAWSPLGLVVAGVLVLIGALGW